MGRLAEAKGLAFESAVEKVFRHRGFRTEIRKYFYLEDGKLPKKDKKDKSSFDGHRCFWSKRRKQGSDSHRMQSAKKQISRRKLLQIVKNFRKIGYYLRDMKKLNVSGIVIGNFNKLDIVDAKRKSEFAIAFFHHTSSIQNTKGN